MEVRRGEQPSRSQSSPQARRRERKAAQAASLLPRARRDEEARLESAEGRWGQKKQAGFYDYDDKRRPSPSPRVQEIIEDFRAKAGITERDITDEEIVQRTLYTMVNEGGKILEEGMAQRASDIDVVWVYGYGWPVYRGGPMCWADAEGLPKIVEGLKRQEERMGSDFSFSKLLLDKAAAGEKFTR